MKTKLLFSRIQNSKNGIFTFLILFFMTIFSYSQSDGITFTFNCGVAISFEAPTGEVNGYPYWTNGSGGGTTFVMFFQTFNGVNQWEVHEVGGSGFPDEDDNPVLNYGVIYFSSPDLNADCEGSWTIDYPKPSDLGTCTSITVDCPGGPIEVCDGIDNDGDGQVDEGLTGCNPDPDTDGDGVLDSVDCDPLDDSVTTSSANDSDNDGVNDCLDVCPDFDDTVDADGDLVPEGCDCNDNDENVYPGAEEVCDGQDNDCDDPNLPEEDRIDEGIENCDNGVILDYCNEAKTKILVCHNGKDICVSINAMPAHEAHEDYIGSCANARLSEGIVETPTSYDVVSWPNPTNDLFNVRMITPNYEDKVNLQAFDINGRLVHSKIINGNEDYQFGTNLQSGIYFVKISQASTTEVIKVIKR